MVEDTYVRGGSYADTNFGTAEKLEFKANASGSKSLYRITLLKFDISDISNTDFDTATLSLNCIAMELSTAPTILNVYKCSDSWYNEWFGDWGETAVTYNSRPDRGELVASTVVYGLGDVRIDITDYLKGAKEKGRSTISFYLEGDTDTPYSLNFASKESGNNIPVLLLGQADGDINTYIEYSGENPWGVAMECVTDWLDRWETIKQGGDSNVELIEKIDGEYSLSVGATLTPNGADTVYTEYPTRAVSTLSGYTSTADKLTMLDVYGGFMDEAMRLPEEERGFFLTKKVGDRWWTFDPLGYPFYRTAVVAVTTGSEGQHERLTDKYGSVSGWAEATSDRLWELGFNSAGGWSNTAELIKTEQPLTQTGIMYVANKYGQAYGLVNSDSASFLYGVIPVFDPQFAKNAEGTVKLAVESYATSPYIYGWMSDNELPAALGMLDSSLILNTDDPRFIYSYATAWTFMYMKTGKTDVSLADVTDELRKEYRAMVYDKYFSIVSKALETYAPYHQYMGCRFLEGCYSDEYVMRVAGHYCDVISVNYYGAWEGDATLLSNMQKQAGKPFIVTEWYAKGMDVWEADERMTNQSGAGWTVKNQNDRGIFYQNYALQLLECKGCVGFDWFRYLDNDPDDLTADETNRNANKGIIDNNCNEYTELTVYMGELNNQKYNLINYFDQR